MRRKALNGLISGGSAQSIPIAHTEIPLAPFSLSDQSIPRSEGAVIFYLCRGVEGQCRVPSAEKSAIQVYALDRDLKLRQGGSAEKSSYTAVPIRSYVR